MKKLFIPLTLLALLLGGCNVDELVEDVNQGIEDAAEKVGEEVEEVNEGLEDASEATGEVVEEVEDALEDASNGE